MLEFVLLSGGYYLFSCISIYCYSIMKTYELCKVWSFNIKDGYVGICKYPRFTLSWVEWIVEKVKAWLVKALY